MKYALGNMLNGAGGLNADQLALDLQFAADKTLTARKGPTPVFTRGSGATQVNAAGLIEYAPENLAFNSENTLPWALNGNVVRVSQDSVVAPNGTQTADRIQFTGGTGGYIATSTAPAGFPAVISAWVKTSSGTAAFRLQLTDTASSNFTATTTWQRFEFYSATAWGAAYAGIRAPSTGDNVTLDVWGLQIERATAARAYNPTTTTAFYGPRFDHDPVTLASRGLLIEESRTNLVLQSENHPSASWLKTGVTVAAVTHTAPDGNTSSNLVSEDASTGLHRLFQGTAYVSGTSYAISVFLKFAGRQFIAITHPAVAANNIAIFDIQNGSVTLQQSGITASMIQYPNGWWRCVVNGVSSITASSSHIIQGSTTGGSLTGSYTGLNGAAFYIYGSQVEAGSFATSYIPTTTASVVRSADVCSISGAAFTSFWNVNEGAAFASGDPRASGATATLLMANSGANVNQIALDRATTTIKFGVANSGSYTATIIQSSANGSFVKISGSYATNDARSALNGILGTPDTSVVVPTNLNRLNIGSSGTGNSEYTNGCIAAIRYFRKPLSNSKLQALTA